jgi:cyclopropane fatty-acyl-phospholipid synthase-like methyltransferase
MVNDSPHFPSAFMPNPLAAFVEKHSAGNGVMARVLRQAVGLAEDFWKDAPANFSIFELTVAGRTFKILNLLKPIRTSESPAIVPAPAPPPKQEPVKAAVSGPHWHALAGEVAEKMWGDGNVLPAGEILFDMLIKPVGLSKDKNVLDLSSGLGGPLRTLVGQVNQIKGCEMDAAVAARGMELSVKAGKGKQAPIEPFDPTTFSMPSIYHVVIARELFYRIPNKPDFFYRVSAGIKVQGHIVFTDYILDPESRDKPGVAAWQAYEKDVKPLALAEMIEAWGRVGFEMRVSEDQTAFYKREIVTGLKRFAAALRIAPPPDAETKATILREVESWVRRIAAFEQGMKFYRFHGIRS